MQPAKVYFDHPRDSEWYQRFDTLFLCESHRKILNRQPIIKTASSEGAFVFVMLIDKKVISN